MIIQAYLKIQKERLSTVKTNRIPFYLDPKGPICGYVSKIHEEISDCIFRCDISVSPDKEQVIIAAMASEKNKLEGREL